MRWREWWARLSTWSRRHLPQKVRTRLTLLYAALFLAGGLVLLGLTFALVSSSLGSGQTSSQLSANANANHKLLEQCKAPKVVAGSNPHSNKSTKTPSPLQQDCKKAFEIGASDAAAAQRARTLDNLHLYSLLGLGLLTLASGALGWVVSGRVLRPVRTITETARRASEQHLGERLSLIGPRDELKELADTFDAMLDRLDAAFTSQSRFVANASHELRTPLTVMRTALEVTLAKPTYTPEQIEAMAAKVWRSIDQAERTIDALLVLARSDQELTNREFVDLATAAEDALDTASPTISDLNLVVDVSLDPAELTGDRILIERMVANVVDNATRHNVDGGWIRLRTGANDGRVFLEIANSGPFVADTVVPSLFEPFQRGEGRTNGAGGVGLGLSIVHAVADAHRATVVALSQAGGGLRVTIEMPRRAGDGEEDRSP